MNLTSRDYRPIGSRSYVSDAATIGVVTAPHPAFMLLGCGDPYFATP